MLVGMHAHSTLECTLLGQDKQQQQKQLSNITACCEVYAALYCVVVLLDTRSWSQAVQTANCALPLGSIR